MAMPDRAAEEPRQKRKRGAQPGHKDQGLHQYPDGTWGIDCILHGRRVRRKVGGKREAVAELQRLKTTQREGGLAVPPPAANERQIMMGEVLEHYAQHKAGCATEQVYCRKWVATLGKLPPEAITLEVMREWVRRRLAHQKPATVRRSLAVLCAAWQDGVQTGLIPRVLVNPAGSPAKLGIPKLNNEREVNLTEEQEARFLAALGVWAAYAIFALRTGIRFGNLARMRWEDVDWERRFVWLPKVKGRARLPIPLTDETEALLRGQLGLSEWCWPSKEGSQLNKNNFRTRVWRPALQAAGIPQARWHDLRHTCASRVAQATGDLYVVQAVLGVSDYRMAQRYAHVGTSRTRAALELISKKQNAE